VQAARLCAIIFLQQIIATGEVDLARYQIMYWKDIPAQVKAQDETGTEKAALPPRFQEAIDAAAMADGSTGTDDYMAGWAWGPHQERPGAAKEVVEAVAAELDMDYPKDRLVTMILEHKNA
jgi:hypothetical protein